MPSHEEASSIIDRWFRVIEDQSPINLCFMTRPISRSMLDRIETLEGIYNRTIIYRFLIRKIHPVIVFFSLTTSLSYLTTRLYRRSTRLVLTLVGVLYPIQRSWNLIRQREGTTEELNGWLTYWMIYGSFQVLDHWVDSDLLPKRKYNLYKLFILYWLQNPHSNGASVIYKHVLLKPSKEEEDHSNKDLVMQPVNSSYRYLDGYISPLPQADNNEDSSTDSSNSSISDDNEHLIQENHNVIPEEKQSFTLLLNSNEAAW
ncbi:hypothetical protein RMATCC62417_17838 [Rhizopus microsporus]|nr:hypothetical protein RMATCC62417_17838 [Rhizopus microsporus]